MLVLWLATVLCGAYVILDQSVTGTYLLVGYADCRAHRDYLHAQAYRRLTRGMIGARRVRVTWSNPPESRELGTHEVRVLYSPEGTYLGSQIAGSTTPDFPED